MGQEVRGGGRGLGKDPVVGQGLWRDYGLKGERVNGRS